MFSMPIFCHLYKELYSLLSEKGFLESSWDSTYAMVAQRLKLWITGQKVRGFKPQHCQNVPVGLISKLHNPPYSSGGPSHLTQTSDSSFQTRQRLLNRNISFYSGIIITRGVANALNLHMGVKGILHSLIVDNYCTGNAFNAYSMTLC